MNGCVWCTCMCHIYAKVVLNGGYCCLSLLGTSSSMSKYSKICKRLRWRVFPGVCSFHVNQWSQWWVFWNHHCLSRDLQVISINNFCFVFNMVGCGIFFHSSAIVVYILINFRNRFFINRIENLAAKITVWGTAGLSVRVQWTSDRPLLLGYPLIKKRPVLGFSRRALSYAKILALSSFGELIFI